MRLPSTDRERTRTTASRAPRARGTRVEPRRLGRYELRGLLGEGGMGAVFEAFDPVLERAIAIKVTRRGRGRDEDAARLVREAIAMARLEHPNVVRVYDVGFEQGQTFVAMELVRGGTLAAWMRAAPRTTREIVAAYLHAGRGLAAAHDAGLVHRDFKPENVLVAKDGRVLVTDFGLARTVARDRLGSNATPFEIAGTPEFMAPEQRSGGTVDARADQYSFCLALWHDLPGLARLRGRIRGALLRGLASDPDKRFASMHELLAAISPRGERDRRGARAVRRPRPTRSCSAATRPGRVRPPS